VDTAASSLGTQLLFLSGNSCSQRQLLFVLVSGAAAPSLSIQVQLLPLSMWTQLSPLVRKFNRVLYAKHFLKCFRNSISSPFPSFLHNSMTTHCQAITQKALVVKLYTYFIEKTILSFCLILFTIFSYILHVYMMRTLCIFYFSLLCLSTIIC